MIEDKGSMSRQKRDCVKLVKVFFLAFIGDGPFLMRIQRYSSAKHTRGTG